MSSTDQDVLGASELSAVERILQRACGVSLSSQLSQSVRTGFANAASLLGLEPRTFLGELQAGEPRSVAALIESSVVCETYFFRHPEQFRALRQLLFRSTPRARPLSIWSAGCATGEEPYSVAMALLRAGRAGSGDRILATDVSERALKKARAGTYGAWSLRRMDAGLRSRFFTSEGPPYSVIKRVRDRVSFQRHNLISDSPPGEFDAVLCRNVLIYFQAETAARVLHDLVRALRPGGLLVLGHAELPLASPLDLEWADCCGTTLLKRPKAFALRKSPNVRLPDLARPTAFETEAAPARTTPPAQPLLLDLFEEARDAARHGDIEKAERLARQAADVELRPEAHLLLSMTAEARGDLRAATESAKRALYLDPHMAMAHAMLVTLYGRLGQSGDSDRARRNAILALEGLEDGVLLRGVESISAGALRRALFP